MNERVVAWLSVYWSPWVRAAAAVHQARVRFGWKSGEWARFYLPEGLA